MQGTGHRGLFAGEPRIQSPQVPLQAMPDELLARLDLVGTHSAGEWVQRLQPGPLTVSLGETQVAALSRGPPRPS